MLNRNGLFGTRDEKTDDKGKTGLDTYGTGSSGTRGSAADSALANPNVLRVAREGNTAAASTSSPAPAAKIDDGQGSKLIVGPNIKLKGVEITDRSEERR